MDSNTIAVKFSAADLTEEAKKEALQSYYENNYVLGQIFSTGPKDSMSIDDLELTFDLAIPEIVTDCSKMSERNRTFETVKQLLGEGRLEEAYNIAGKLIDHSSPELKFIRQFKEAEAAKLQGEKNLLPWTSKDSITILPL
mmetsp:Transcript_11017/g.21594  ORF Transcript_11017/g.21594 Transcript_11017/m.21594 type:complete len:141 (+) Transcript_11017:2816-3238(+)